LKKSIKVKQRKENSMIVKIKKEVDMNINIWNQILAPEYNDYTKWVRKSNFVEKMGCFP